MQTHHPKPSSTIIVSMIEIYIWNEMQGGHSQGAICMVVILQGDHLQGGLKNGYSQASHLQGWDMKIKLSWDYI